MGKRRTHKAIQAEIGRGYTAPDDPIVGKVQQWFLLVTQGSDSIASARTVGVSIPLLRELPSFASEVDLQQRTSVPPVESDR
jgi:hypothetical protein